jgi:predicted regulator of Ras-like GTPase activity (Roadblock/LC7/MglB family)
MLSILKKLFGKSEPKAAAPIAPARASHVNEPTSTMPTVEVAHLSLAAIVSRFPDELKMTVLTAPDDAATIALPLPLIYKQLASGAVKMSLASLHRQAPQGVFGPLAVGDKRQVEIPLQEIFRHVSPYALKRRMDQRPLDTPDNDFNLFGNSEKPFEIAPTTPENPPRKDSTVLNFKPAPSSRIGRIDPSAPPAPGARPSGISPSNGMRLVAPPSEYPSPQPAAAPAPKSDEPPLVLPLAPLINSWPEPICGELAALDSAATVTLDAGAVAAGLAKGKVIFTWGEIRAGLEPALSEPTSVDESTALQLPLKFVAPAFLAASKKGKVERKNVEVDASIPALFNDGREPASVVEAPPSPAKEAPVDQAPAPVAEPQVVLTAPEPDKAPETVGGIFGDPHKLEFTPAEIVAGTVKLPGVAGAIVALQEGLQVATSLPEGIKSDVVAAFLPQIFARLNQYAGEMKMGEVDDLLFTTHGAHCQIYRLGFVYFAILGQPGAALPWHELRLIAAELGRQTNQ